MQVLSGHLNSSGAHLLPRAKFIHTLGSFESGYWRQSNTDDMANVAGMYSLQPSSASRQNFLHGGIAKPESMIQGGSRSKHRSSSSRLLQDDFARKPKKGNERFTSKRFVSPIMFGKVVVLKGNTDAQKFSVLLWHFPAIDGHWSWYWMCCFCFISSSSRRLLLLLSARLPLMARVERMAIITCMFVFILLEFVVWKTCLFLFNSFNLHRVEFSN